MGSQRYPQHLGATIYCTANHCCSCQHFYKPATHKQAAPLFKYSSGNTAPTKCAMVTFLLCSNVATKLLIGMKRTELASRFGRGSVGSASACLAGLSKRAAHSQRSFNNASLAVALAWGIKATLPCATVLTNYIRELSL